MIWIILLGGMVQGAFAQNLEDKGNGAGRSQQRNLGICKCGIANNGLSFVAGTTTDMKGHFLLNKIKKRGVIFYLSLV